MKIGASDIEIALASRRKQKRGRAIYQDADPGHNQYSRTGDGYERGEALRCFQAIAPTAARRNMALKSAARIDELRSP